MKKGWEWSNEVEKERKGNCIRREEENELLEWKTNKSVVIR